MSGLPVEIQGSLQVRADWLIVGALEKDVGSTYQPLPKDESVGRWRLLQIKLDEGIALEMDSQKMSALEVVVQMQIHKWALEYAFSLVAGTSYTARSLRAMRLDSNRPSTIDLSSHLGSTPEENPPITDTDVERMRRLYELLIKIDLRDPRPRLLLDDLVAAARERTKFALVHLYRGMEGIKGYFGGWKEMERALGVHKELELIKRLRSEKKYRVAHSDVIAAVANLVEPTPEEIADARRNALAVTELFLSFLEALP